MFIKSAAELKHATILLSSMLVVMMTFTSALPTFAYSLETLEQTPYPTASKSHPSIARQINKLIRNSHYKKPRLNDAFSETILNRFIDQLDPSKSFFLKEDIEQFQSLKHEFDDYVKLGILDPAYAIFRIFRTRVDQRIQFALERLQEPFNFKLDEQFLLDREDAQWADSIDELNDYWRKRIKNDIINQRLSNKDESEIIESLARRYTHIARRTRQFKGEDVFQSFINAYMTSIEPHTSYYSPRGAENFKIHMSLKLEGIGAVLQTDNEYTLVRRIIPGGPADQSGLLQSEDRIIGVGQENEEIVDVIGWRLDDVVALIRGPKESRVVLEILPGEDGIDGKSESITIVRDEIKLEEQAASKQIIEVATDLGKSKIGVIRLPSFYIDFDGRNINDPNYRSTTRDVKKLVKELKQQNIDGMIIDLRGNGGGALSEAISLTGLFIQQGPVVQVQSSNGRKNIDRDPDPRISYSGPLAVLVDQFSASASEIFAGAIQDYNRGLIIGEPTFGKGTVQNLVNLNRHMNINEDLGQLKITIAQFFRVNGDSTQHRGVIPDITWYTSIHNEDSGERNFENAIPWRHIDEVSFMPFSSAFDIQALDNAINNHLKRAKQDPDFNYVFEVNRINAEFREMTLVSLDEETRRKDRIKRDQQRLELENNRRKALGEPVLASIDELDAEESDPNLTEDANNDSEPDAFLVESGRILSDFLYLMADPTNSEDTTLVGQGVVGESETLSN